MKHELKTWPKEFQAVLEGAKRHEVRRSDDRTFRKGDEVVLQEYRTAQPGKLVLAVGYTGRELTFTIGHVTAGPSWGLPEDLCVFTLLEKASAGSIPDGWVGAEDDDPAGDRLRGR